MCTKIYKKSKNNNSYCYNSDTSKEKMISSSSFNYNNKRENYLIKNLTYSFKYKSVTYEYDEEKNEIIPVYLDLTKMTNKGVLNFFSEGLSSEELIKKVKERYEKNEYYINLELLYYYFLKIELPHIIWILINGIIDVILKDYISLFAKIIIMISTFFGLFLIGKKVIYGIYPKEYTLDGEENKLKVKRRHKLTNNKFYYEIKNCDLLVGDILYLKSNDFVPCDCLILEGECIISESNLTGKFNNMKKTSLENNNEPFNYKLNKNKILYHGMKIIKTYSKLNEGYISVLCINIGPNTFKANQLSNILYMLERKKSYKEMYTLFGEDRLQMLILTASVFFFTLLLGTFYLFVLYPDEVNIKDSSTLKLLYTSIIRIFNKSFMPVFFLTNSIIIIIGLHHLTKEKIYGFEKSKVLNSYSIDTIFFCKTGTLSDSNIEINCLHPVYINPHKSNSITYKTYKLNQCKEMNSQLVKYYKDYLFKTQNNILSQNFNLRQGLKVDLNQLNVNKINKEAYECTTLFIECLLSCNNLEKYNIEIFGNNIETSMFKHMGWDIKANNININENLNNEYIGQESNKNYIRYDIYPNNYYKITESRSNEINPSYKPIITRFNSKFYLEQLKKSKNDNLEELNFNYIKNDIEQSHINSYKLRIYKRYTKEENLLSSAIVYNFITKELRFMTKGMPEDILDKCEPNSLPDNFDQIISLFRKNGLIIIICASKIINIDTYKDSNPIENYMNELTFCGFITLKIKLKKEIVNSIKDLKQFNCNLNILTGDNIYNALSAGFNSSILENKNIFSFDKTDKKNGIIITKLYSVKKIDEEEEDKTNINISLDKISRQTSKISNRFMHSPYTKKDNLKIKNIDNSIRNSRTKSGTNEFSLENSKNEGENKNLNKKRNLRRGSINKNYKASKNLFAYDENKSSQKRSRLYSDINNSRNNQNQLKTENCSNSNVSNMNSNKNQPSDAISRKNKALIQTQTEDIEMSPNLEIKLYHI